MDKKLRIIARDAQYIFCMFVCRGHVAWDVGFSRWFAGTYSPFYISNNVPTCFVMCKFVEKLMALM
jgi:hypothetical protein